MSEKLERDTTILLELSIGEYGPAVLHRFAFQTMEDAKAQLVLLQPKIGRGKFTNDPDNQQHTIVSADGEATVAVGHVIMARIIDRAAFHELAEWSRVNEDEDMLRRHAQAIADGITMAREAERKSDPDA